MLHENLLLILLLLFAIFLLIMLGRSLKISYPIFLVIGGLLISLIPGIPAFKIDPQLVFIIFLPPLLYEAAWYTSWKDFWKWRRDIGLLGFGLVLFTSLIVAFVSHAMIPGFTLALGFLLGGIISPPDVVAAKSVLGGVKIPRRIFAVLEGESLVNDAASLTVFRFALLAIISGTFKFQQAAIDFFLVTFMGIIIGLIIAHLFYILHRWFPTTPSMDTAFTFMAPYLMYLAAEHFQYSGVLAVVSGGLFLSYRSHEILNYNSRLQAAGVWATVTFILNGVVFILIGLQLPLIVKGLGNYSLQEAIKYGLIISLVAIVVRIIWVYSAGFLPRRLSNTIRVQEKKPRAGGLFLVSWAGMRGVVSLASALSVPLLLSSGEVFPQRDLILFITFVVILVTLVLQGLSLPLLSRILNLKESDDEVPDEKQELAIHVRLMQVSLNYLNKTYGEVMNKNELIGNLEKDLENKISVSARRLESLEYDMIPKQEAALYQQALLDLERVQREELSWIRQEKTYSDHILRKKEAQLDFEEAKLQ